MVDSAKIRQERIDLFLEALSKEPIATRFLMDLMGDGINAVEERRAATARELSKAQSNYDIAEREWAKVSQKMIKELQALLKK